MRQYPSDISREEYEEIREDCIIIFPVIFCRNFISKHTPVRPFDNIILLNLL